MNLTKPPFSITLYQYDQTYSYATIATLAAFIALFYRSYTGSGYSHIPSITESNLFTSYLAALRYPKEGKKWVLDGYKKFRNQIFRLPLMSRWHLVITDERLIDELSRASPDTLSIKAAFDETLLAKYMLGETVTVNRYHVPLIRSQLTRHIISLFPDVMEEVILAIQDNFPLTEDWKAMTVYNPIAQVVARASNRVFVGLPLCRNPGYISVNIRHAREVAKGMGIVSYFPNILKPLAAKALTNVPRSVKAVCEYIRPLVEERQDKINRYGADYPGKPADFLSWMMDEAEGKERTHEAFGNRIIHMNFVSLHTTIMTFTHALYNLAAYPEYMQPLRKEVEKAVASEGWTRAGTSRMRKLDSFFKETLRLSSFSTVSLTRLALKDYTFSNGTRVPKGTLISAAILGRHLDEGLYDQAEIFDGFRFSRTRERDDQNAPNEFVATSVDYLAFGHGNHACPGRFFAANELKIMMAYLIVHYDIKMKNEGVRPENIFHGLECRPDVTAEVLFRERRI